MIEGTAILEHLLEHFETNALMRRMLTLKVAHGG